MLQNNNNNNINATSSPYSYHDEPESTANMKNNEDNDHPLFSSPKQSN